MVGENDQMTALGKRFRSTVTAASRHLDMKIALVVAAAVQKNYDTGYNLNLLWICREYPGRDLDPRTLCNVLGQRIGDVNSDRNICHFLFSCPCAACYRQPLKP